jgi:serine/threonine protein kinase
LVRGSFAVVKKATRRKTGEEVAVKIFNKYAQFKSDFRATLGEDDELALKNEVEILSHVNGLY